MNEVDGNSIDYNNSGAANADNDAQDNTDAFVAHFEQDEENEERASLEQINDVINEENYNNRPRRTNAGMGVDRLQMSFDGKAYTHEKERQFLIVDEDYNKDEGMNTYYSDMNTYYSMACDVMFTQMSAKKGIKMFGERAIAALLKEYNQMDKGPMPGKPVFGAVDYHTLSEQEKKEALEAVNLIKEKRDGKIKGRTCANGSKQRQYLKDGENVYSPTCAMESLMTTLIIDALEKRDVAIFDVPGAFLQTEMPKDKNVLLVIRDEFVDILCEVNPQYKEHVRIVNGKKILYVKILRAIYGCIESAMLWYNLYTETLKRMGFILNPYDRCVANKLINGKQCTIVFHVDDNKLSHADEKVVTEIIKEISKHFGDLAVTRGRSHNFLGIDILLGEDGLVEISQHDQVQEALNKFGETYDHHVSSPCANHLWDVNENAEKLSKEKSDLFHSIVAKLLYITKRSRPDIETAVAFLTTRVSKSDIDDWKKLKRLMTWMNQTKDNTRVIGAKNVHELYTWIDAAFAVHMDMRSHTGGLMSFGRGMIHCRSSKQKLNTKSSTEAEVVGVSEYIPFNLWMAMFLKEQGYDLSKNIVFQDNESAIKMLKNGRDSCTGRSRHIDIRHFFVKDRVDKREVDIEYCPTKLMIADYLTKPLQGKQFLLFRELIMGWKNIDDILQAIRQTAKERVESNELSSGSWPKQLALSANTKRSQKSTSS